MDEAEVAFVHGGTHGVAPLMAVDALGLAMAGIALRRIDAGHLRVDPVPGQVVIGRTERRQVIVASGAGWRSCRQLRRTLSVAVMASRTTRMQGAGG